MGNLLSSLGFGTRTDGATKTVLRIALPSWRLGRPLVSIQKRSEPVVTRDELTSLFVGELNTSASLIARLTKSERSEVEMTNFLRAALMSTSKAA
jgi:hypothetical protein